MCPARLPRWTGCWRPCGRTRADCPHRAANPWRRGPPGRRCTDVWTRQHWPACTRRAMLRPSCRPSHFSIWATLLHSSPSDNSLTSALSGLRLDVRACHPHSRWIFFFDGSETPALASLVDTARPGCRPRLHGLTFVRQPACPSHRAAACHRGLEQRERGRGVRRISRAQEHIHRIGILHTDTFCAKVPVYRMLAQYDGVFARGDRLPGCRPREVGFSVKFECFSLIVFLGLPLRTAARLPASHRR